MSLVDVEIPPLPAELPADIRRLIDQGESRADEYLWEQTAHFQGFVPCGFEIVCKGIIAISQASLAPGNSFCEWGSGLGVVASVAAMLGHDAHGIEINRDLHELACELAEDFEIAVELTHGSFIPPSADQLIDKAYAKSDGSLSLVTHADDAYEQIGLEISDFDLIFSFPWPNDAALTANLFHKYAAIGALLLTFEEPDLLRLRRRV